MPGKTSIPPGSLWSLRVWLRANSIAHRLFGEDDLWVGKDLDFNIISDASFARLKSVDANTQLYHGFVGKALTTFIIRYVYLTRVCSPEPHAFKMETSNRKHL